MGEGERVCVGESKTMERSYLRVDADGTVEDDCMQVSVHTQTLCLSVYTHSWAHDTMRVG